jgi:hypothetical protein
MAQSRVLRSLLSTATSRILRQQSDVGGGGHLPPLPESAVQQLANRAGHGSASEQQRASAQQGQAVAQQQAMQAQTPMPTAHQYSMGQLGQPHPQPQPQQQQQQQTQLTSYPGQAGGVPNLQDSLDPLQQFQQLAQQQQQQQQQHSAGSLPRYPHSLLGQPTLDHSANSPIAAGPDWPAQASAQYNSQPLQGSGLAQQDASLNEMLNGIGQPGNTLVGSFLGGDEWSMLMSSLGLQPPQ